MEASEPRKAADADPEDGRDETEAERMDRNWNEMLQELRVTQTATQILFGFLLAVAFQPRFADLDAFARTLYLVLISVAALTTGLALAPVAIHRGLFRQHRKRVTVQVAHVILGCTIVGVGVVLVGTVLLIFHVTVGTWAAVGMAAGIGVVIVAVAVLPTALASGSAGERQG